MSSPSIVWLRRDLRLSDQRAFVAAAHIGPVIPVYVLDDETPGDRILGGASRWWLHHSLAALDAELRAKGSRLILRKGRAAKVIARLARETGAKSVHYLAHYEPWWRLAEKELADAVPDDVEACCHNGNYLLPPGAVTTGGGKPYKIYTPFWRALNERMPPAAPVRAPQNIESPENWPDSDSIDDWNLTPKVPDWAEGFAALWVPGENSARRSLDRFMDKVGDYDAGRNLPSDDLTSMFSPHLHFGEISPATIWHRLTGEGKFPETFLKEIAWRDYAQNIIVQFPDYGGGNARDRFDKLEWRDFRSSTVRDEFELWTRGHTGYPIVDAGMRQLWTTGWMHNRVRMIAASFLIKHLLIDWRRGEQWFWDTLVDADYGSNSTNWQWVAGTGIDSNMFSRIMAPLSQSEKFDAADYIRQWVPELAGLPDDVIHDPEGNGCRPKDYAKQIIGHKQARARALAAYDRVKG